MKAKARETVPRHHGLRAVVMLTFGSTRPGLDVERVRVGADRGLPQEPRRSSGADQSKAAQGVCEPRHATTTRAVKERGVEHHVASDGGSTQAVPRVRYPTLSSSEVRDDDASSRIGRAGVVLRVHVLRTDLPRDAHLP